VFANSAKYDLVFSRIPPKVPQRTKQHVHGKDFLLEHLGWVKLLQRSLLVCWTFRKLILECEPTRLMRGMGKNGIPTLGVLI